MVLGGSPFRQVEFIIKRVNIPLPRQSTEIYPDFPKMPGIFFDYYIKMLNLVFIQSCDDLFTRRSYNETIRKSSPNFLA